MAPTIEVVRRTVKAARDTQAANRTGRTMANDTDAKLQKLIDNNIFMARKHDEYMNGKTRGEVAAWLKTLFATYDVVWGLWSDPISGFGMFPIKGNEAFKSALAQGGGITLNMTAVQCTPEEGQIAQQAARIAEGEIQL